MSGSIEEDDEDKRKKAKSMITYSIFFQNRESIFILLASSICMLSLYHFETILSVHLTKTMGMDEDNLGFFFCA